MGIRVGIVLFSSHFGFKAQISFRVSLLLSPQCGLNFSRQDNLSECQSERLKLLSESEFGLSLAHSETAEDGNLYLEHKMHTD